jgi:hypothetical protein
MCSDKDSGLTLGCVPEGRSQEVAEGWLHSGWYRGPDDKESTKSLQGVEQLCERKSSVANTGNKDEKGKSRIDAEQYQHCWQGHLRVFQLPCEPFPPFIVEINTLRPCMVDFLFSEKPDERRSGIGVAGE